MGRWRHDAVNWAINQGVANKDNICIYGGSYGSYAHLAGMTSTPEAYKCGVGTGLDSSSMLGPIAQWNAAQDWRCGQ